MFLRIIPKLDIKGPNLVKGINFEGLRSLGNPNHYAKIYYAQGADEIIINDVVASLYGRDNLYKILNQASKDVFIPVTAGGGIRNEKDIREVLKSGADKIMVNSSILANPTLINQFANIFGSSTICANIEAKKINNDYYCYYNFGRENSGKKVSDWVNEVQDRGIGEILLSSVDYDGLKKGMNMELLKYLFSKCSIKVPLIFGSGIGKLSDLNDDLKSFEISGIFFGSFLHYNNLDLSKNQNDIEGNRFFLDELKKKEHKEYNIFSIKKFLKKNNFDVRV